MYKYFRPFLIVMSFFHFFDKINVNQTSSVRNSGSMPFEVFAADDCVRYQRSGSCVPSDNGLLSESTQVILSIHLYNGVNSVIVCISKPAKRNWISLHIEAAESNTLRPEQIVTNQTCVYSQKFWRMLFFGAQLLLVSINQCSNGLTTIRWHGLTWSNDCIVPWQIYALVAQCVNIICRYIIISVSSLLTCD